MDLKHCHTREGNTESFTPELKTQGKTKPFKSELKKIFTKIY